MGCAAVWLIGLQTADVEPDVLEQPAVTAAASNTDETLMCMKLVLAIYTRK
jgi:hypothetical protein